MSLRSDVLLVKVKVKTLFLSVLVSTDFYQVIMYGFSFIDVFFGCKGTNK